ncbi:hypothetical protein Q5P01_001144 [Channa striata]|uniref:Uncharacterized protein n=1 Tax=Channa striata TaxID=64152 RepID=A0AA88NQE5_CHASR|nr:hypothetical protein Q5P01_001144 [Channa striata]
MASPVGVGRGASAFLVCKYQVVTEMITQVNLTKKRFTKRVCVWSGTLDLDVLSEPRSPSLHHEEETTSAALLRDTFTEDVHLLETQFCPGHLVNHSCRVS